MRYLHFCPDPFGYIEKQLDKRVMVNFKIYDDKGSRTNNYNTHTAQNPIHILPKISTSKSNQMRQLIEHNMGNIFLDKSFLMKKLVSDLFKIKTEEISGSNSRKFYKVCFYCMFKFWHAKIY